MISRQEKASILSKVSGVTATRKSFQSISKRLVQTNNRPVNRSRLTISRRTPGQRISTTQNGKYSIRRHSTRDVRPAGFVSTGTESTSLSLARVNDVELAGATAVFETSIDDYAEIWVDGELARAPGQSGGSVVKGWNAANRLIINRSVQPGQKIQLAIFGANGPLSNPPTNYIYMREAKLEFYKGGVVPVAITPSEVNVEVLRKDPAIDAIVPPNPKIFKLAEGFKFTEGPVWDRKGGFLLFSDPNNNTIYKYSPEGNGHLAVFRNKSGYEGADIAEYGQPGSNGLTFDPQGRLTIDQHGNHRVVRVEPDGQLTVLADKFEGKRLNSPNDLVYRSDGTLYFTDPPFGLPKFFDDPRKELPFSGVFAVKDGNLQLVTKDFTGPNGIAFSPDEKYLYVGDWDEKKKVVMRYEVQPDGSVKNGKIFFDMTSAPGEDATRRNESGQGRKPLRFRPGWPMDSLTARQTSRHDHSAETPAQFCLGRRRWENALPLRAQRIVSNATEHRGHSTVNDPTEHSQDGRGPAGASPRALAGISLRGSRARAVHDLGRTVHDSASSSGDLRFSISSPASSCDGC